MKTGEGNVQTGFASLQKGNANLHSPSASMAAVFATLQNRFANLHTRFANVQKLFVNDLLRRDNWFRCRELGCMMRRLLPSSDGLSNDPSRTRCCDQVQR